MLPSLNATHVTLGQVLSWSLTSLTGKMKVILGTDTGITDSSLVSWGTQGET